MGFSGLEQEFEFREIHEERAREMNPDREKGAVIYSKSQDEDSLRCPFYGSIQNERVTCIVDMGKTNKPDYSLRHCTIDKKKCSTYIKEFGGSE